MVGVPLAGHSMQPGYLVREAPREFGPQHLGEDREVLVPLADMVDPAHERAARLQIPQRLLSTGRAHQRVGKATVYALGKAGAQEEIERIG